MPRISSTESPKGRRVSIDLTAPAAAEVDRLRALTDMSTADLFRHAFHLLRTYIDQRAKGNFLYFANPDDPANKPVQIEIPIIIAPAKAQPLVNRSTKVGPK